MVRGIQNAYFTVINNSVIGLAENFSVNPSSCENSAFYTSYLRYIALSDLNAGKTTTHLFIDEDANRIMGFVSLRASSIIFEGENGTPIGSPALEIMVLAVAEEYERRGVGSALIDYVISQADELHKCFAGVEYIILAADTKAKGFYEKMGFTPLENRWMPKERWSTTCDSMALFLDFEREHNVSYADLDDDDK